jgi:hypothetical protein
VSVQALVLSWVCNLFFVIYSIVQVQGWFQIWTLLYSLVFMNISWEIERLMRVFFVQNRLKLAADRRDAKRKHSNDILVLKDVHKVNMVKLVNEKRLAESEKMQLRSLVSIYGQILKSFFVSIIFDIY